MQKFQCRAEDCAALSHASSQHRPEWFKDTACKISNTEVTGRIQDDFMSSEKKRNIERAGNKATGFK